MRKTTALLLAGSLLLATPVLAADNRSDRSREDAPAPAPAPSLPNFPGLPGAIQTPSHGNGAISSGATASTNSGGNSGSNVTTGPQTSNVTVTNVGPVKDNSQTVIIGGQVQNPPAPTPAPNNTPSCDDRGCITRSR